ADNLRIKNEQSNKKYAPKANILLFWDEKCKNKNDFVTEKCLHGVFLLFYYSFGIWHGTCIIKK
ncbi:MAG: hypothetical protein ACI4QO_05030, partial [Clostridia bacterium]